MKQRNVCPAAKRGGNSGSRPGSQGNERQRNVGRIVGGLRARPATSCSRASNSGCRFAGLPPPRPTSATLGRLEFRRSPKSRTRWDLKRRPPQAEIRAAFPLLVIDALRDLINCPESSHFKSLALTLNFRRLARQPLPTCCHRSAHVPQAIWNSTYDLFAHDYEFLHSPPSPN
jgi:hypothetical protein